MQPTRLTRPALRIALAVTAVAAAGNAQAQFTYTGPNNGSWQTIGNWAPMALGPPPAFGDTAVIAANRDVLLNDDVLGLAGLTVSNQGDLLTNGYLLDVFNVAGTAEADIVGNGTTGNNTELFVQPNTGGLIDFSLNVDILNLENGGELDLVNDAIVHVNRRIRVDAMSIITGTGTILFTDAHNVTGRRLNLLGTLRPDSNGTITLETESGTIDLDGSTHNDNFVDLTNSGSRLNVRGPLRDSFTGVIELGSNARLDMDEAWVFGPQPGNDPGPATIEFDPGDGNVARIIGAPITIGGGGDSDALVRVRTGTGRITPDATIQSNAVIQVLAGARLDLDGDVTYTGSATITGSGTFDAGATNSVIGNVTIGTDTVDFDNGHWDIAQQLTLNTETVDGLSGNTFNGHTIDIHSQAIGNNGRLTVNLPDGESWRLANDAMMNITAPNGGFTALNLAGSELRVNGTIQIDGHSRFSAPIDVESQGVIQLADGDSSLTLTSDSRWSGGLITGDGQLRSSTAVVRGHGQILSEVSFSGSSELWADDGTLRIAGDLDDLGAAIGTADDDGVLLIEESIFDTALAGEVRLNGGGWIDGAANSFVQNTQNGQIRGHGDIHVESINNYGIIAAEGGTLQINNRLDWDGSIGALGNEGDGVLQATDGDLLLTAMHQAPSFVGTVRIGRGHSLTFDTGSDDDEILFDDSSGDDDAGNDIGRLRMTGGTLVADVVTNQGQFTIGTSPSTIVADEILFGPLSDSVVNATLQLDTSGGLTSFIDAGASFSGNGSLSNTTGSVLIVQDEADVGVAVTNAGMLHVGAGPFVSPIVADIELRRLLQRSSGELVIELAGTGLDEFDRIAATESASLDGTLVATFLGDFEASLGDVFPILATGGGGVSGTFSTEDLPELTASGGEHGLFARYQATLVELVATFVADFDLDGDVDGDDFLAWQLNFGTHADATHAEGDADGDGDVDGDDFLQWQLQFGNAIGLGGGAGGGTSAVPEPASAAGLIALATTLLLRGRMRSGNRRPNVRESRRRIA